MPKSFPKNTPVITPDGQGISDGQLWVNGSLLVYVKYKQKLNNPVGKHYNNGTYEYYAENVEEFKK